MSKNYPDDFWYRVDTNAPNGCWQWPGRPTNRGYCQWGIGGKRIYVHRWSYEYAVGPVPAGLVLDHICRNRACVNPAHLRAVTQRENILCGHGAAARSAKATACPQGHVYDDANTYRCKGRRYCRACVGKRRSEHEKRTKRWLTRRRPA